MSAEAHDGWTAEGGLPPSDELIRALVHNSRDIIGLISLDGTVLWIADTVQDMLGHVPSAVVGMSAFDLIHPEDRDPSAARFAHVITDDDDPGSLLLRVKHHDGSDVHVEALGKVLTDAQGNAETVLINLRDATTRLAAEAALRASEARFRTVVSGAFDVTAVVDRDATISWVTPNCERLLGWRPDEVEGRNGLELVHPDDVPYMVGELSAFVEGRGVPNPTSIRMLHKDGSWRDVEVVGTDFLDHPDIGGIAVNLRDVTERRRLERELEHAATHDPLTGLPNRTLLLDRLGVALGRAERSGGRLAVLFCDLDDFKVVNDTLGHRTGDEVLAQVAQRLAHHVRPGDTVARFGGDEFVILCEDLADAAEATAIAERVGAALTEPVQVGDRQVQVGVSVGIALLGPDDEQLADGDEILRRADLAMYQVKAARRS